MAVRQPGDETRRRFDLRLLVRHLERRLRFWLPWRWRSRHSADPLLALILASQRDRQAGSARSSLVATRMAERVASETVWPGRARRGAVNLAEQDRQRSA